MSWRKGNIPNAARWQRFRLTILDRDNWECVRCKRKAARLEVDHINGHDAGIYDPANCQTLCRSCHLDRSRKIENPQVAAWRTFMAESLFID